MTLGDLEPFELLDEVLEATARAGRLGLTPGELVGDSRMHFVCHYRRLAIHRALSLGLEAAEVADQFDRTVAFVRDADRRVRRQVRERRVPTLRALERLDEALLEALGDEVLAELTAPDVSSTLAMR